MKHSFSYQREVDKGKLTAVASFEKLAFRARALRRIKAKTRTHNPQSSALLRRRTPARNVSFSKLATAVNLPLSTSR